MGGHGDIPITRSQPNVTVDVVTARPFLHLRERGKRTSGFGCNGVPPLRICDIRPAGTKMRRVPFCSIQLRGISVARRKVKRLFARIFGRARGLCHPKNSSSLNPICGVHGYARPPCRSLGATAERIFQTDTGFYHVAGPTAVVADRSTKALQCRYFRWVDRFRPWHTICHP
jgi:hypothetical protein